VIMVAGLWCRCLSVPVHPRSSELMFYKLDRFCCRESREKKIEGLDDAESTEQDRTEAM
jgi:hypothetical protein